jgi:hypothetical protein
MISHITDKFRKAFAEMPADVQKQARQAYRLFIENPHHPSLRFKPIHPTRPIYSVRIGMDYRAVGIRNGVTSFGTGLVPTPNMTS